MTGTQMIRTANAITALRSGVTSDPQFSFALASFLIDYSSIIENLNASRQPPEHLAEFATTARAATQRTPEELATTDKGMAAADARVRGLYESNPNEAAEFDQFSNYVARLMRAPVFVSLLMVPLASFPVLDLTQMRDLSVFGYSDAE